MTKSDPPTPTSTPPRSGPMYVAGHQTGGSQSSRNAQHSFTSFQPRAQNQSFDPMCTTQASNNDPFLDNHDSDPPRSLQRITPMGSITPMSGITSMGDMPLSIDMDIEMPASANAFLQVSSAPSQYLQTASSGYNFASNRPVSDFMQPIDTSRQASSRSGPFAECDNRDFPGISNPLSTPVLSPAQAKPASSSFTYPPPNISQVYLGSHFGQNTQSYQPVLQTNFSSTPLSTAQTSTHYPTDSLRGNTSLFYSPDYAGNSHKTQQHTGLSASPRSEYPRSEYPRSEYPRSEHPRVSYHQMQHNVPFYDTPGSSVRMDFQNQPYMAPHHLTPQLHSRAIQRDLAPPYSDSNQLGPVPKELRPYDRRFLVRGIPPYMEARELLKLLQDFNNKIGPSMVELDSKGQIWIGFTDMREAQKFTQRILREHPTWTLEPVSDTMFKQGSKLVNSQSSAFDDQVLVFVYGGPGSEVPVSDVVTAIKPLLELVGPVYTIKDLPLDNLARGARFTMNELIVRYFDSQHAANAVKALNAVRENSFVIEVLPYNKGMEAGKVRHWTVPAQETARDRRADPYMSPEDRDRSPATPDRSPVSQVIYPPHILSGGDSRTTVMLKNIPNGMRWIDLKTIVDTTSPCRYDFLYLRMDFEENQNVGYAFVNFLTPEDIVPFMTAREGQHWPGYDRPTEKIAEISYATSQGRAALIEKFRNSPVMLDLRDNRPKLFHTMGPLAGQESPFPPVNNFWTLAKSVDRSKKSGLYRVGGRSGAPATRGRRHSEGSPLETPVRGNRRDPHDPDDDGNRGHGSQTYQFAPSNSPGTSRR